MDLLRLPPSNKAGGRISQTFFQGQLLAGSSNFVENLFRLNGIYSHHNDTTLIQLESYTNDSFNSEQLRLYHL